MGKYFFFLSLFISLPFGMSFFRSLWKTSKKNDCEKLKVALMMAQKRLASIQKKKKELTAKEKVEIASFLKENKLESARIHVKNVIRDDFRVEAYEILESYCESLLSRFSVIEKSNEIDPSITEAVSGICWAFSHVSDELSEFNQLRKEFKHRYGQEYVKNAMENKFSPFLSKELIRKLTSQPSADLIERYLIEIAKHYSINFTPDFNKLNTLN